MEVVAWMGLVAWYQPEGLSLYHPSAAAKVAIIVTPKTCQSGRREMRVVQRPV
jgi:hypothetical protein